MTTCIYSLSAWLSLVTFLGFALHFKSPESFHVHVYHSFPSFMRFFHEPEFKNILSSSPLKSHNHKSSITAPICPLKFSLIPHRRGISKQEVQAPFLLISQENWKELVFLPNISFPFFCFKFCIENEFGEKLVFSFPGTPSTCSSFSFLWAVLRGNRLCCGCVHHLSPSRIVHLFQASDTHFHLFPENK